MMLELAMDQFECVRHLFQEIDYSLSILAAIVGNNPGRIFVDDSEHPKTALGNNRQAIMYLNEAVDHGMIHVEWTSQVEKFTNLAGTPEWEAALERLEVE